MKPLSELAMLAVTTLAVAASAAEPQILPWQREIPLRKAAQSVVLQMLRGQWREVAAHLVSLQPGTLPWGPSSAPQGRTD